MNSQKSNFADLKEYNLYVASDKSMNKLEMDMKKLLMVFSMTVCILIFGMFYINEKQQVEIYVAPNGSDVNSGTKEEPFRTLKKAASVARAGTTVYVREGTYKEELVVQHNGKAFNEVIFKPYNHETVVLSGENTKREEGDTSIVTIESKSHISIEEFIIKDLKTDLANETVMGIFVTGSSNHITLKDNHVQQIETHSKDGNGHGIAVYGTGPTKNIAITNNIVENLKLGASEALVLNGNVSEFNISQNIVRRNDNIGIDLIGYEGVSSDERVDFVRNGIVSKNTVHDISTYDNPAYGKEYNAGGIYVDGGKDIKIEENSVYHSDIGIEATSEHKGKYAENIEIVNNKIYENRFTGISIGGYDEERGGTRNSTVSQNVLYQNDTKEMGGGQLLIQHDADGNTIEKNTLIAGPSRIFIANYFLTSKNNQMKENIFHKEAGKEGIWIWEDKELTSFPDFKSASDSDKKSSYLDSGYIHPAKLKLD